MDVIAKQFTFIFKRKRNDVLYCVMFFVGVIVIIHSLYAYRLFIDYINTKKNQSINNVRCPQAANEFTEKQ